jgi:hypothetical protein
MDSKGRKSIGPDVVPARRSLWAKAGPILGMFMLSVTLCPASARAQSATASATRDKQPQASALAQKQAGGEVSLTATSANVSESGSPVRIRILRWSTEEERSPLIAALTPGRPIAVPAGPGADSPAGAAANPPAADRGGAARGGRGAAAGRGGRGGARGARGGRGGDAPPDPIAALTTAIAREPTLGYIWTNDVTGYAIKYAYHAPLPDGGERIVLATDRRLGAYSPAWKPVGAPTVTDYEFTLVEIRLDSKGSGEGKTSLTTKVTVDGETRTVALDNYAATPTVFQNVKR